MGHKNLTHIFYIAVNCEEIFSQLIHDLSEKVRRFKNIMREEGDNNVEHKQS